MSSQANKSMEILKECQSASLYDKLLLQIKKDFERANVSFKFSMDIAPADLNKLLKEKIYFLLLENLPTYQSLLYIVDIPEKMVSEIKALDVVDASEQICFLLLKREWQKVKFRDKFKS